MHASMSAGTSADPRDIEGFRASTVVTDDGVRLCVYERPAPDPGAPTLFLVNGLGGNLITWRHQIARLGPHYRIVTWDYRGLYASALTPAQKSAKVALDVPRHARDAVAILDHFGVERAVFVGWSMGVQLNFELAQRVPERIIGMIQIAGSFGRSLSTTWFGKPGERFILPAMGIFKHVVANGGRLIDRAIESGLLIGAARRLGVVASSIDVGLTRELVAAYVHLDFDVYNTILGTLGDHDAEAALPSLRVPVLILAGDRDPMTPAWLSKRMAAEIPDAELIIVPGGSHYVPIEFPERVNAVLTDWLHRKLGHDLG